MFSEPTEDVEDGIVADTSTEKKENSEEVEAGKKDENEVDKGKVKFESKASIVGDEETKVVLEKAVVKAYRRSLKEFKRQTSSETPPRPLRRSRFARSFRRIRSGDRKHGASLCACGLFLLVTMGAYALAVMYIINKARGVC